MKREEESSINRPPDDRFVGDTDIVADTDVQDRDSIGEHERANRFLSPEDAAYQKWMAGTDDDITPPSDEEGAARELDGE